MRNLILLLENDDDKVRSRGRNKNGRRHVKSIRCTNCDEAAPIVSHQEICNPKKSSKPLLCLTSLMPSSMI
uniref:Uncharacterized protein n=1 Tax=Ditylenchus dipsaci TaxID=166011 RepID=A0A915E384_9BILA